MNTKYEFHEIASIFPLIDGDEFNALVEDIRSHGVREPMHIFEGKILDGRNRYRAAQVACVEVDTVQFSGTTIDAIEYVWSLNYTRRHLTPSTSAIADAKRNKLYDTYRTIKEAAKERQTANLKRGSETPVKELIPERESPPQTRDLRAKAAGTNSKYIDVADRLIESYPELADQVESGKKTISQVQKELRKIDLSTKIPEKPSGKHRIIYADPPWSYNDKCDEGSVQSGGAEKHYPSMSVQELCDLNISDISQDDSVLFLWATSPLLPDALKVAAAWGFKYKASFVWDKVKHNMGHYNSVRHEFLLICTKGSCTPDVKKLFDSVQSIEKTTHSTKPQEFRRIIDTLYDHGDRIELFRRGIAPDGWKIWGNEADG